MSGRTAWVAYPVIEGDEYSVTIERAGVVIRSGIHPEAARELADMLTDAAHEPDWCRRCGERYSIHGDECDLCNERPAPRWT